MNVGLVRHLVVIAMGGLSASCAVSTPAVDPTLSFAPAPRSALVSPPLLSFKMAQVERPGVRTTILAHQRSGAAPEPLARLIQTQHGTESHVSVQMLPGVPNGVGGELVMATLGQLYSMVLRLDPQARYCMGTDSLPCTAARDGMSHSQVLQRLADVRASVADRTPAAVPWQVVQINAAPTRSWDADVVGVRVTTGQTPLEGIPVYFDRAPHSICTARTLADGVAVCRLIDQHGDGHEHDHAAPVVATFPGDVRTDRVLLPTTQVLVRPTMTLGTPIVLPGRQ